VNAKLLADSSLIVAAAFYGVLLTLAAAAGLFGIWLGFFLLLSLWRFAYSVLRVAAQGKHRIPPPEIESLNPFAEFRLVLHFIAFPALLILLTTVQPFGTEGIGRALNGIGALLVIFALPASAAMMAMSSNLEDAFRPSNIIYVVRTFGASYALLVVVCVALVIAAELLSTYALPRLGFVTRALGNSVTVWALLAAFGLTGSLVRMHRTAFEIPGETEPEEDRATRLQHDEWRKDLDLAYGSIRSGLVAEGHETLRRLSARHGDGAEIQYWLFENMLDWEDRRHALEIGARLIERRVAAEDHYAALELFARCRGLRPDFALAPPVAGALAAFARSIGRHGAADDLAAAAGGWPAPREL